MALSGLVVGALLFGPGHGLADGLFVFKWNRQIDISEPTQKAIILHDQGREDLVLQVRYDGPAEEFGWLVPVPGLPEVRKGTMEGFYELSRLTQKHFAARAVERGRTMGIGGDEDDSVKVIRIETVGAYEVTILAAGNAAKLAQWLEANGFVFPAEKQAVLDGYVRKKWYFVAIKINPEQSGFVVRQNSPEAGAAGKKISASTRRKLANGELNPLVISFAAEKCVFPLAISAVNGKPSEISLYVLSVEPLMSRAIFDRQMAADIKAWKEQMAAHAKARKEWLEREPARRQEEAEQTKEADKARDKRLAELRSRMDTNSSLAARFQYEDPADPRPPGASLRELTGMGVNPFADETNDDDPGIGLVLTSMEVRAGDLPASSRELPRLAGKSWWLTKQVQVFAPEEMQDLEFEPAIPFLAGLLHSRDDTARGFLCLRQFGTLAVPAVLAGMKSPETEERRLACAAASEMKDSRLGAAAVDLLDDENARTREMACYTVGGNWDETFASRLAGKLSDPSESVRSAASWILREHPNDSLLPTYRKLLEGDTVAAGKAILLVDIESYSRTEQLHFFSSTNLPVVATAFSLLRDSLTVEEVAPLLTNPLPMARLMGLGTLARIGSKPAADAMIPLLRDPNEVIQWRVRSSLRRITGQKLGADPAAYEKWWKENRETFTPPPPDLRRQGQPSF